MTVQDMVGERLVRYGLLRPNAPLEVSSLSGGVSSVVLLVRAPEASFVVKRPLERFDVPDEWVVKRERVLVEAQALTLANRILPGSVPGVRHLDREDLVLVMDAAPDGWTSWKQHLLDGDADPHVAAWLGEVLRRLHDATAGMLLRGFEDPEIFGQQRAEPYYRTTMRRRPELAAAMGELLDRMLATKRCLVHGDWSPKNVLTGPDGRWVIDWEVAHHGDASFDVAFLLNHLCLKALHRPRNADGYRACADAFIDAYGTLEDPAYAFAHVGALMSARVDGKSPAEYLTSEERRTARAVASSLLLDPPTSLPEAWRRVSGPREG